MTASSREHEAFGERLGEHLVSALDADEKARMEGHLAACAPCREELEGLARLESALASSREAAPEPKRREPAPSMQLVAPLVPAAALACPEPSLLSEFLAFLRDEKRWWLAPMLVMLAAFSAVIVFAEGSSIAPFIYSLF